MRDGESLNQKKPWPLSSALRPFCSAKLAVVGRYLHSYIEIAKKAGSSPETLRKAFRELQQHGVIEKTPRGYFVTSDKTAVTAFRERYLASIEEAYHSAIAKVQI